MTLDYNNKLYDEHGIPLEDAIILFGIKKERSFFLVGSYSKGDANRYTKYAFSVGAVYTEYRKKWTDEQRVIHLLTKTLIALMSYPDLILEDVIRELMKIDVFYYGINQQYPFYDRKLQK